MTKLNVLKNKFFLQNIYADRKMFLFAYKISSDPKALGRSQLGNAATNISTVWAFHSLTRIFNKPFPM